MATKPTIEDFVAFLKLQAAPSEEATALLTEALETAIEDIEGRCTLGDDVDAEAYPRRLRFAELATAARLVKVAQTPSGIESFGEFGAHTMASSSPDVERLIAPYLTPPGVA